MANTEDRIKQLSEQLEKLSHKQEAFGKAIRMLREEIYRLQASAGLPAQSEPVAEQEVVESIGSLELKQERIEMEYSTPPLDKKTSALADQQATTSSPATKSNFEQFIGENLINKIGIIILVLGVGFGAKYSIDHQLISPLTRIILGYMAGAGLLAFAIRLKPNYENFSAVLLSGAMAILYFITFSAYSFYDLIPQAAAFALMVLFTAFTVFAALAYNKQVIALIGLTGAYAVPFLLSSGSGQVAVLFSYMAIVNIGILFIAVKKYWKALFYVGFLLTWIIFFSWFALDYHYDDYFGLALGYSCLFFLIFYATFLANKMINNKQFAASDIFLLFFNAFIFFGIGYALLSAHHEELLGLFTLVNAMIHFVVSYVVYQRKLADSNVQYLISGLVLVFITITIPVQLDGNWVTLLWAGEAALLFWLGRTNAIPVYEKLSYPLMLLAFGSLVQDWDNAYHPYYLAEEDRFKSIFNVQFLSSMLFVGLFAFINWINSNDQYPQADFIKNKFFKYLSYIIPGIFLVALYSSFRVEIDYYWQCLHEDSAIPKSISEDYLGSFRNSDLLQYKTIWVVNYSLLFLSLLSFVNIKTIKSKPLAVVNLLFNLLGTGAFLTISLYAFSYLRESYLSQSMAAYYNIGVFNIGIRYVSFVFLGIILYACHAYTRKFFTEKLYQDIFDLVLNIALLWVLSSELIHWLDMAGSSENYKIGLSILWAVYSLILIAIGIWKNKAYWRMGAMALFGITLLKLFFYDISELDTISKTIVFISIGVLLLLASFLYNKFKQHIFEEE